MQFSYPPVRRLAIHLEDEQTICYRDDEQTELANLLDRAAEEKTMLLAWFDYNRDHPEGSHLQLLYHQFPTHFSWQAKRREWQPRRRTSDSIGRMYITSPSEAPLKSQHATSSCLQLYVSHEAVHTSCCSLAGSVCSYIMQQPATMCLH